MSCSIPVFACIQDINRVTSILNDAPTSEEQDVKENVGESGVCEHDVSGWLLNWIEWAPLAEFCVFPQLRAGNGDLKHHVFNLKSTDQSILEFTFSPD